MTFARVVQIGYVFILVPILLSQWGVEVYGEWLILSAIASFGMLANFGMFQASAVEIALAAGSGDREGASKITITTLVMSVAFIAAVLSLAWIGLSFADPRTLFGVHSISAKDAVAVTMLSLSSVVIAVFIPPLAASVNVTVGNAPSTVVSALIRLVELIAITGTVFAGGGPASVATVLVASVCLNVLCHAALVRYWVPWLSFGVRHFDVAVLRRLIRPSIAQFLLYVSMNILIVQMPRIILGHVADASAVAVFGVTVTYARAARTLTTLFSQSLQSETTRAFAEKRYDILTKLAEGLCQSHLWISIAALIGLLVLGEPIFAFWTHAKIAFDPWLCLFLGIGFVISAYTDAIVSILLGINRIVVSAIVHLSASIVALGIAVPAVAKFGLIGMAVPLLIPEIAMAVAAVFVVAELLSVQRTAFFVRSLHWPVALVANEWRRVARFLFNKVA